MDNKLLKALWTIGTSIVPRVPDSDLAALQTGGWIDETGKLTQAGQDYVQAMAY